MNKPLFLWYGSHCQRDDTSVSTHYSSTLTARVARGLSPENRQHFNSLELASWSQQTFRAHQEPVSVQPVLRLWRWQLAMLKPGTGTMHVSNYRWSETFTVLHNRLRILPDRATFIYVRRTRYQVRNHFCGSTTPHLGSKSTFYSLPVELQVLQVLRSCCTPEAARASLRRGVNLELLLSSAPVLPAACFSGWMKTFPSVEAFADLTAVNIIFRLLGIATYKAQVKAHGMQVPL